MIQREIKDADNITWQCVQAFSGINGEMTAKAEEKIMNEDGQVIVVCTPSGGAQTVRLKLDMNWKDSLSDEMLLEKINKGRS